MTRVSSGSSPRSRLLTAGSRHRSAIVLLAFVVLTAGCSGFIGGDDVDDSPPLDDIPAAADGLIHVQSAVLTDSTTETLMDGLLEMDTPEADDGFDSPESWENLLEEVEDDADVELENIHSTTVFMGGDELHSGEPYTGVILQTDLSWEEFEELADEEADAEVEEDTYSGVTVYIEEDEFSDVDTWVADFGDGTFAFGPEPVVKDVIDTREGDADGIDDDLRERFEQTTDGYLRAAFVLTDEQADLAGDVAEEEAGIGQMFIPELEAVTMSYHTEGDRMNAEIDLVMQSSEEAGMFVALAEPILNPPTVDDDADPSEDPLGWTSNAVTIEENDERVSLSFAAEPDELLDALEALEEPVFDDEFASQPGASTAG